MTCEHLRQRVEPDRPIPSWARPHLAECSACRTYVEDLVRLRRALAALAEVPVPEDFEHRVHARLRAAVGRSPALWPRALALAALGGIAFALFFTVGRERLRPPDPPRAEVSRPSPPILSPQHEARSHGAPEAVRSDENPPQPQLARSKDMSALRATASSPPGRDRGAPIGSSSHSPALPTDQLADRIADLLDARSLSDGVILLLRNEETQEESVLAIPPVVFGSRPLMLRPASSERAELRRIL